MASLSSAGIGSGLDVNTIVAKLVAAERAPADNRINRLETTTKAQISAFGSIKAALSGLESALKKLDGAGSLPGRKATVGADAGFAASASSTAATGTYSVVVDQLATAHKLQSAAAAKDTQIGNGTLTIQVGSGDSFDITIEPGKGTLNDIRSAINAQGVGKGVSATIVRGDAGDVLVLSSTKTGSEGAMTITSSGGDGGLSVLNTSGGTLTVAAAAQDAQVTVDGISRTVSSNHITDMIDGVTLDLTKAKPGESFSLEVTSDPSTLKASMLSVVSAYNTALSAIRTQSAAGGEGAVAGALSGDSMTRGIQQSLRNAIGGSYSDLAEMGFKTAVDGSLSLDGAKFDAAMAADPGKIKAVFGEEGSLGKGMRDMLHNYLGDQGTLTDRTKGLNDRLKSATQQRTDLDARMSRVEAAYLRQFTALDTMMAKMQSTSNYLAQQLGQISNSK